MKKQSYFVLGPLVVAALLGCHKASPPTAETPAHVEHPIAETDLPSVRLSAQARERLGIQTTKVLASNLRRVRWVGGEVVTPPGRTLSITAPVAGAVRFVGATSPLPGSAVVRGTALLRMTTLAATDRDTHARTAREVAAAEANLAALQLRVQRNQTLVAEQAGSARALEEAIAQRDIAQADVNSARTRATTLARNPILSDVSLLIHAPNNGIIRQLGVAEGQVVPAGALLFELAMVDSLHVRVPVYGGDVRELDVAQDAEVRHLHGEEATTANFVAGPPTSEFDRNSVDRYLALPHASEFTPGERVMVALPLRTLQNTTHIPSSAIVYDAWGGAWVYRCDAESFTRIRVNPVRLARAQVELAHGPSVGTCIVSVGAAELFGTEFPPGH